jgi:hypothetical protein
MAQLNFDATQVQPQAALEAIPAGWYNAMVVESGMKATSGGEGSYLELVLKIVDGQYAGNKLFDRLNLDNKNPTAVEVAYRRLSSYCHATGVLRVQDSQQLHGIPVKVKVSVRIDNTGQYEPSNDVKAIKPYAENNGGPQAFPQTQAFPQPQGAVQAPQVAAFPQAPQVAAFPQAAAPAQPATAFPQWAPQVQAQPQQPQAQPQPAAASPDPWTAMAQAQPQPQAAVQGETQWGTGPAAPGPTPPWAQ